MRPPPERSREPDWRRPFSPLSGAASPPACRALLLALLVCSPGCRKGEGSSDPTGTGAASEPPAAAGETEPETGFVGGIAPRPIAEIASRLCSTCHRLPPADILPRWRWDHQVRKMYGILQGRDDVVFPGLPPVESVIAWFQKRAPERLPLIATTAGQGPGGLSLRRRPLGIGGLDPYPATANVRFVRFTHRRRLDLLLCDMRWGFVLLMTPSADGKSFAARKLGDVPHPCRAEPVDLDRDGRLDLLVANLGTLTPSDETNGSIEWLRSLGGLRFERRTLASKLGRVSDARAADFDGDGDLDIVSAVFGWRKVGDVLYLENVAPTGKAPRFEPRVLDPRPGSIHVPIVDLDGDGRLDFIALFAQQFETVVAFLNRGGARFEPRTIFEAPHPNWGSSGIEVVDFDRDGDLDVVYANGDTLDDEIFKPYHGVQWLENRGEFPFAYHRITDLYGAHFAKPADLDGDGDLDLVVCAYLPFLRETMPGAREFESLIWLERTASGAFERHSLETLTTFHPTIDAGDFDGDGDVDIVAGNMTMAARAEDTLAHWVLLLENQAH